METHNKTMLVIEGSAGEGGGQILRSSLSLSLATGIPFRIENIRAKRKKPGLLRQHLTAVLAAVEIGDGKADGAHLGSQTLTFTPGRVREHPEMTDSNPKVATNSLSANGHPLRLPAMAQTAMRNRGRCPPRK